MVHPEVVDEEMFGDEHDLPEGDGEGAAATDGVILWNPNAPNPPPNGEFERIGSDADAPCDPRLDFEVSVGPRPSNGNRRTVIVLRDGGELLRDKCDLTEMKARRKLAEVAARRAGVEPDPDLVECIEVMFNRAYDTADEMQGGVPAEPGAADKILTLARPAIVELFCDRGGKEYATVERTVVDENGDEITAVETMPLRGGRFKKLLRKLAVDAKMKVQSGSLLSEVQETFAAEADLGGRVRDVPMRVGLTTVDGRRAFVLDLNHRDGKAVVATSAGWEVVDRSPVPFRRTPYMGRLPIPQRPGDVHLLKPLVNLPECEYPLLMAAVLATFLPTGSRPVIFVTGEHGSAKTSLAVLIARVADPQQLQDGEWTDRAGVLRGGDDLTTAASNAHVNVFDNVGPLAAATSNLLCVLSTGGRDPKRKLYTDDELHLLRLRSMAILTSLTEIATAEDLISRGLFLNPTAVAEDAYMDPADVRARFDEVWPRVLAGFLDAVVYGLRALENGEADDVPRTRMADFTRFVSAAEPALGFKRGTAVGLMKGAAREAEQEAMEQYPAVLALIDVLRDGAKNLSLRPVGEPDTLRGTATELLDAAKSHAEVRGNAPNWPSNGQSFSTQLGNCKGTLRKLGVNYEKLGRGKGRMKQVKLIDCPGIVRDRPAGPSETKIVRTKEDRQAMFSKAKEAAKRRAGGKVCSVTRPARESVLGENTAPNLGDAPQEEAGDFASNASHATRPGNVEGTNGETAV